MIYTTEVLGLQCQVKGTLHHDGFDIDWIKHKGEMMDTYGIKDAVLDAVAEEILRSIAASSNECQSILENNRGEL
jgi:hypothetical protein